MDKVKIILNPYAGRWRALQTKPMIEKLFTVSEVDFDLELTEKPGSAKQIAHRARLEGYSIVVAAGGDGTVNEVVNGLAQAADEAGQYAVETLGILPIGSANDMAEMSGVPRNLTRACAAIKAKRTRQIDLGRVNDRYFDNNVGIGFEAQVTIESRKIKRLRGTLLYLIAVFRALRTYPSPRIRVKWDHGEMHMPMLMVSVGNGPRAGGGFFITPDAQFDDEQFDLGITKSLPRLQILQLLPKVLRGTHKNSPAITLTRSRHVRVESEFPIPVHADGEVIYTDAQHLEISLQPGRLKLII